MRVAIAIALALSVATGCADSAPPGDPAIHADIAAETDCDVLDNIHDVAVAVGQQSDPGTYQLESSVAYAETAWDRKMEIGCWQPVGPARD